MAARPQCLCGRRIKWKEGPAEALEGSGLCLRPFALVHHGPGSRFKCHRQGGDHTKRVRTVSLLSQSAHMETSFIHFESAVTSGGCYPISLGHSQPTNVCLSPLSPCLPIISIPLCALPAQLFCLSGARLTCDGARVSCAASLLRLQSSLAPWSPPEPLLPT